VKKNIEIVNATDRLRNDVWFFVLVVVVFSFFSILFQIAILEAQLAESEEKWRKEEKR
jgi:hypothetical protein